MGREDAVSPAIIAFEKWADEVYDLTREDGEYVDGDTREAYAEWQEGWGKDEGATEGGGGL